MDFALTDRPGIAVLWLCGYELGQVELVRAWRARHPEALLLVTGRKGGGAWEAEVFAAGADETLTWPLDMARLARLLRTRRLERRA